MFCFCCARILLASAYYKTSTSRAPLFKELTQQSEKFMNNQHSAISTNLAIVDTSREYFSISVYGQKHQPCFYNVLVFHKLYELCLTNGHGFSKTTYTRQSEVLPFFFRQNFHLNLLRCLCRITKRFLGLNNSLGELVQKANK